MEGIAALDRSLFHLLNQVWISPVLDVVMPVLTDFDNWRIPVILTVLVFLIAGDWTTRRGILFAVLAVVIADQAVAAGLKPVFDRERPFRVIDETRKLVGAHGESFPSAHAANTFAAGVFLALRFRRWRWILVLPVLVGYSRVYVGVHYPGDVLAGAVVGAVIGGAMAWTDRVGVPRLIARLRA